MLKKLLKAILLLVVIIFSVLVFTPIIFKEDIKAAVDSKLKKNLKAEVYYDTDHFSLSFFTYFPRLTVSLSDFGLVGINQFSSDTLIAINNFELSVDLGALIKGKIVVNKILLDQPNLFIKVMKDGTANYDIVVDSSSTASPVNEKEIFDESPQSNDMSIAIRSWEIKNGKFSYQDQASTIDLNINGIQHTGSGDFGLSVFDLYSSTTIQNIKFEYESLDYLENISLDAEIILNVDLNKMAFLFKDNTISLKGFDMGFEGDVLMKEENIDFNLNFEGDNIGIKSLLALIPGVYQEYVEGVRASGQVGFKGFIKGSYNDSSMPHIQALLNVKEGKFKHTDYPLPIDQLTINAMMDYPSADLRDFSFDLNELSFLLDGERVTTSLKIDNLLDYKWDFGFDGSLDLSKLTEVMPIENTRLKGKFNAKLTSNGQLSFLESGQYKNLPTSGSMSIIGFFYKSDYFEQGFGIDQSNLNFQPSRIDLINFKGNVGETDLALSGEIENYLGFFLGKDELLTGKFDFKSQIIDINEWITDYDPAAVEDEEDQDSTEYEIPRIPTNIDFYFASSIKKIKYSSIELDEFNGLVSVRNGVLKFNPINFKVLDGQFNLKGFYDTTPEEILYDFDLQVEKISIPTAYKSFSTVKRLAPFAEKMTGEFSSELIIGGSLYSNVSPNYNTMQGSCLLNVANASLNDVKLLQKISKLSGSSILSDNEGNLLLNDVLVQFQIQDGRVYVNPFEFEIGKQKAELSGSNSIEGELDYSILLKNVNAGLAGQAFNTAVSKFGIGDDLNYQEMDVDMAIGGTFSEPVVALKAIKPSASDDKMTTKEIVKEKAGKELKKAKEEVEKEVEKIKEEAIKAVDFKKEDIKNELKEEKNKVSDKAKEELDNAKKKLKGLLKKKGGN